MLEAVPPPPRRPLADVINAAHAGAQRTVALIDSTKFGRQSLLTIMAANEPDLIITDRALEPDEASAYVAAGVALETLSTKEAA
jgi:DeoR/GlpR family transcriptional regulator of sugar metabolism